MQLLKKEAQGLVYVLSGKKNVRFWGKRNGCRSVWGEEAAAATLAFNVCEDLEMPQNCY